MKIVENREIYASLCDSEANLSVIGAFQIVQDAMTKLMKSKQIDGISLSERCGAFWVFTKNRLKFFNLPKWNDIVVVDCFLSFKSLVKINIDVCIKDQNQNILVYSKIEACAIDKNNKIQRLKDIGVDEILTVEPAQYEIQYSRQNAQNLSLIDNICVKSTSIDFCKHTNNIEYVRFLVNCFSIKDLVSKPIKEFEIDYLNQCYENDNLSIFKEEHENDILFEIRRENDLILKGEIVR